MQELPATSNNGVDRQEVERFRILGYDTHAILRATYFQRLMASLTMLLYLICRTRLRTRTSSGQYMAVMWVFQLMISFHYLYLYYDPFFIQGVSQNNMSE